MVGAWVGVGTGVVGAEAGVVDGVGAAVALVVFVSVVFAKKVMISASSLLLISRLRFVEELGVRNNEAMGI